MKKIIILFVTLMISGLQLPANQNLTTAPQDLSEMKDQVSKGINAGLERQFAKVPDKIAEAQNHIEITLKFIQSKIGMREAFGEDVSNLKNILAEYTAFLNELNAENYDTEILQQHIINLNYHISQVPEEEYRQYYAYRIGGSLYFLKADYKLVNMAYLMKDKKDDIKDLSKDEAPLLHYVANKESYCKKFFKNLALDKYVVQIVKIRYPHLDEE